MQRVSTQLLLHNLANSHKPWSKPLDFSFGVLAGCKRCYGINQGHPSGSVGTKCPKSRHEQQDKRGGCKVQKGGCSSRSRHKNTGPWNLRRPDLHEEGRESGHPPALAAVARRNVAAALAQPGCPGKDEASKRPRYPAAIGDGLRS